MAERFRLATLLKLREQTRDERRRHLVEAQRAEDMLRQQMADLDAQLAAVRAEYGAAAAPGRVLVDRLVDAQRYEIVLHTQRQERARQEQLLAAEVERRRAALLEADREVRVLEKLREKQQERQREEDARQEVKRLDEVASRRAVWRAT